MTDATPSPNARLSIGPLDWPGVARTNEFGPPANWAGASSPKNGYAPEFPFTNPTEIPREKGQTPAAARVNSPAEQAAAKTLPPVEVWVRNEPETTDNEPAEGEDTSKKADTPAALSDPQATGAIADVAVEPAYPKKVAFPTSNAGAPPEAGASGASSKGDEMLRNTQFLMDACSRYSASG